MHPCNAAMLQPLQLCCHEAVLALAGVAAARWWIVRRAWRSAQPPAKAARLHPICAAPSLPKLCPPCCRYYAALQPCVHYLPFWQQSEDDVLGLLHALRGAPANQALARALAANSYTFAAAVLGDAGVYRYWQRVIDRYVELYRGPVDAQATLAAKAWAERVGQRASAHGAVVEAKCWADGGQNCWCAQAVGDRVEGLLPSGAVWASPRHAIALCDVRVSS